MPGESTADPREFVWRQGRDLVSLRRQENGWRVSALRVGRLLGPQHCVHEATHHIAKHAAWDVMARVINASKDEELGVQTAMQAHQWMRRIEDGGGGSTRA